MTQRNYTQDELLAICQDPNRLAQLLAQINNANVAEDNEQAARVAANVEEIADPATASAEDCANKINEIIQALIAAGLMDPAP